MKKWIVKTIGAAGMLGALFGWFRTLVRERKEIDYRDARIDKFKRYFDLTNEWLRLKNQRRNLEEYFVKNGWSHIAIYGMGELGCRLTEELQDSCVTVEYAIDKKGGNMSSKTVIKELKEELPPVDVIVVTPVFAYDEVEEALMDRVDYPIVSMEDVVFSM